MPIGWYFNQRLPKDDVQNPIQGEFFDESSDPDERALGVARPFIRETIQNSIDARVRDGGDETVELRILLARGDDAVDAAAWFDELGAHLTARGAGLRDVPASFDATEFLVIEDFGTRGLEGDVEQWRLPEEDDRNDFYAFFRADGLSGKSGREGGRWGVGKSVFNRLSRCNAFLATTVRADEPRRLLFGKCVLKHHVDAAGQEYMPYGRYGERENDVDAIAPVLEDESLDAFHALFRLRREPDARGLSVVVPFPEADLDAAALVRAVVRQYFDPILAGRLVVTVEGDGLVGSEARIDTDSLVAQLSAVGEEEFLPIIELAAWGRSPESDPPITLGHPGERAPSWSDSMFADLPDAAEVGRRFRMGERLRFRVPVRVRRRDGDERESQFEVFLQRDGEGRGQVPVFVRNGIIVSDALKRRVRGQQLFAVVVVDDDPLAEMLGDAEPPAHNHWSVDTANFRGKYYHGAEVINFVKQAPGRIAEFLGRTQAARDRLILSDFFPSTSPDDGLETYDEPDTHVGPDTTDVDDDPEIDEGTGEAFRIDYRDRGFRVVPRTTDTAERPVALRIGVGYIGGGSPLSKWHPADFDVTDRMSGSSGVVVRETVGNELVLEVLDDDYLVEFTGFDRERDVYVRVDAVDELPALTEAAT